MKKRIVKQLSLTKERISSLNPKKIKGGTDWPDTAHYCNPISDGCTKTFTCGDCINTWGDPDPGCYTGILYICAIKNPR